jgi:AraC-like DNA-binding protein
MENKFYIPNDTCLKDVIRSVWQVDELTKFKKEIIIPKGIVEIIFNFSEGDSIQTKLGERKLTIGKCLINGFNTDPIQLQLPERHTFFGVRFHPASIRNIFGFPASEFANRAIDLTLLDSNFNSLWHQIAEQKSFHKRITIILNWIKKKYLCISTRDQLFNHFLNDLNNEILSVRELSNLLCYSPRHLSRKIHALTGMNIEATLLYKKYLYSINLIHDTNLSLTQIAYQCQFADQSHFIKTFRAFASITPGEYRKIKGEIQGHFYENVR